MMQIVYSVSSRTNYDDPKRPKQEMVYGVVAIKSPPKNGCHLDGVKPESNLIFIYNRLGEMISIDASAIRELRAALKIAQEVVDGDRLWWDPCLPAIHPMKIGEPLTKEVK